MKLRTKRQHLLGRMAVGSNAASQNPKACIKAFDGLEHVYRLLIPWRDDAGISLLLGVFTDGFIVE